MSVSIPKGVFDIIPEEGLLENQWKESHKYQYLNKLFASMAELYGYEEISTPIFEKTELFQRSIGDETDIVNKEMYTFLDKKKRSLTLRPEGTASVMRAFNQHQMHQQASFHKLFYIGQMFRYERQQAGRYRQFNQFGAEAIGLPSSFVDVELIDFTYSLFKKLGIKDISILINSIGDSLCREKYREALVDYLTPYKNDLSEDSQRRLEKNPLRILDSKDTKDQEIIKDAPIILDYLEPDSKAHFEEVQNQLSILNIPYKMTPSLVRGLDYYNRTVFEVTSGDLGAHNTLAAGGRYDSLLKNLGGPNLPAVGFAAGIERILQVMHVQKCPFPNRPTPLLLIAPIGESALNTGFQTVKQLRENNLPTEIDLSGKKLKHVLKHANKKGIPFVAILGDEELSLGQISLKNMKSGEEEKLPINALTSTLADKYHAS